MIKFFRNIRKNLLNDGKTTKYTKYAIGEIVLVVIGILIALQINNWNELRKESKLENQLIDVLITDLQLKKEECLSDLDYGNRILEQSAAILKNWNNSGKIDTLYLKPILSTLAEDDWFFNENSPVYSTVSGSGLWKQLPENLTRQIDNIYRSSFGSIKSCFEKQTDYALHGKLNYLVPNHLLDLDKNIFEIQQIVTDNSEDFISLVELFRSGVIRLTSKFKTIIPSIDKLIEDLEFYKNNKHE